MFFRNEESHPEVSGRKRRANTWLSNAINDALIAEDDDENEVTGRYESYQKLLDNLMLIGTLILGFQITGALVSVHMTGEEAFGSDELYKFLGKVGSGSLLAMGTIVLAWAALSRASDRRTTGGVRDGHRAMVHSLFIIGLSELSMYLSLYFFLGSTEAFVAMTYIGPDICPFPRNTLVSRKLLKNRERENSPCADTANDLFEAADEFCQRANHMDDPVCTNYPPTTDGHLDPCLAVCDYFNFSTSSQSFSQNRFGWDTSMNTYFCHHKGKHCTQNKVDINTWFDVSVKLSDIKCRRTEFEDRMTTLCNASGAETGLDVSLTNVCEDAYITFRAADECVDQMFEDVKKCQKVCAWNHGRPPAEEVYGMINIGFYVGYVVVLLIACVRMLRITWKTIVHCKIQALQEGLMAPVLSHLWLSELCVTLQQARQDMRQRLTTETSSRGTVEPELLGGVNNS